MRALPAGRGEKGDQASFRERGCEFLPADLSSLYLLGGNLNGTEFIYRGQTMRLPLLGDHQLQKRCDGSDRFEVLRKKGFRITLEHMRSGLARVAFPARLELLSRRPVVLLDGAQPGGPPCWPKRSGNTSPARRSSPLWV